MAFENNKSNIQGFKQMTDNLDLNLLKIHINNLDSELKILYEYYTDCWVIRSDNETDEYCLCGCRNPPIGNIYIRIKKPTSTKIYGLKIYPTKKCLLAIIDCENKGAYINYDFYEAIRNWLDSIPREMERQQHRTSIIRNELLMRIFKSSYD